MSINLVLGHKNGSFEIKVLYFKIINACLVKQNFKIEQLKYVKVKFNSQMT